MRPARILRGRRAWAGVLLLLGSGACAGGDPALGARLFDGRAALSARLAGSDVALPVTASRCANCHRRDGTAASSATDRFGPVLNRSTLRERLARRGGPASAHDERSFCRVLRAGIDPAHVVIDQRMPRYDASDAECAALWAYLAGAS